MTFARAVRQKLYVAQTQGRIPDGLFEVLSPNFFAVVSDNPDFIDEAAEKACELVIKTWTLMYQELGTKTAEKVLGGMTLTLKK